MNLHGQAAQLLEAYPGSFCIVSNGELLWQGRLQPEPASREYLANVVYGPYPFVPLAYVVDPDPNVLVAASALPHRRLPHVYNLPRDPLCLFTGVGHEWSPSDWVAKTTVPWISLWLRFFEIWLGTNTWEGSGGPALQGPPRPSLNFEPPTPEHLTSLTPPDMTFAPGTFRQPTPL